MSLDVPAEDGPTQIGRQMPPREDRRFLLGQGRYLDDFAFPRAPHARFIRSPHAHARIAVIDAAASRADNAAEQALVEHHALPAVVDAAAVRRPGAPRVDDALDGNLAPHRCSTAGDPARRFANAQRIIEARFHQHRQTHALMGIRGCCAVWDASREHRDAHRQPGAPTGSKGMPAGGVMGTIGAVTGAVNDALAPFAVVAERQPLTPVVVFGLLTHR